MDEETRKRLESLEEVVKTLLEIIELHKERLINLESREDAV